MLENGPVTLRFETYGDGLPILLLAPGGLRASRIETWSNAPWNPIEALRDRYQVVAMDQRNTGTSFAPISGDDGWHTYAGDQIAVMDHLGIERFTVMGMCIGGAFILKLIEQVPERVAAAVAMQPIGLDSNRDAFRGMLEDWRGAIGGDHPEATDEDWESVWTNLYGRDDLLWSVPDELLPTITTPLLVLQGDDVYHPKSVSQHLAATVPSATLVERWKDRADQPAARAAVDDFLTTRGS